jgi:hypothetical protein
VGIGAIAKPESASDIIAGRRVAHDAELCLVDSHAEAKAPRENPIGGEGSRRGSRKFAPAPGRRVRTLLLRNANPGSGGPGPGLGLGGLSAGDQSCG